MTRRTLLALDLEFCLSSCIHHLIDTLHYWIIATVTLFLLFDFHDIIHVFIERFASDNQKRCASSPLSSPQLLRSPIASKLLALLTSLHIHIVSILHTERLRWCNQGSEMF